MANLFDYLKWRGDLSFEVDKFNEVDNLILAELSYVDMKGIMEKNSVITIEELNEKFWATHTEEEIQNSPDFTRFCPPITKALAGTKRFGGMLIGNYVEKISAENVEQFSAMTFELPNGQIYVAFRGTDSTITGWKEDFNMSYMNSTAAQKSAADYLNSYFKNDDCELMLGGHSKGGNLAVFAAMYCDPNVAKRVTRVFSNDGPGFRKEIVESEAYKNVLPKVTSIVPVNSMIGILLFNDYKHIVVKTEKKGIWGHDGTGWQVLGNHFEECEHREEDSYILEEAMHNWLNEIPDEDRRKFVDMLFSFYDSSEKDDIHEMWNDKAAAFKFMLSNYRNMNAEERAQFAGMLSSFMGMAGNVVNVDLRTRWNKFAQQVSSRFGRKGAADEECFNNLPAAAREEIILASASPRRSELLGAAGVKFSVFISNASEDSTAKHPGQRAMENATLKAKAVAKELGAAVGDRRIVSADTIVAYAGLALGKPKDEEDAVKMLMMLSGKVHEVYTGVCILKGDVIDEFFECTKVKMKPFTEEEARDYVATGEPMDKAGAYGIQGIGGKLVEEIEGDFDNVVGFPVEAYLKRF